jgi:hypothetical protein
LKESSRKKSNKDCFVVAKGAPPRNDETLNYNQITVVASPRSLRAVSGNPFFARRRGHLFQQAPKK